MNARTQLHLRRGALVLGVLATVAALIGVRHRSADGRNALLKWHWAFAALESGEPVYGTGPETAERPTSEGFPAPPATLVLLTPFDALGPTWGPLAWGLTQAALAWFIVLSALRLGAGRARDFGGLGALLVVLLSGRVLYSELQHGNVNLTVGATVAAAAVAFGRGGAGRAGVWLGAGAALKATPALGVVWLLRAGSLRGLVGFALGLVVVGLGLPALALGPERALALLAGWWEQMASPYLSGREVGFVQSEHQNQSLLGVLARHLTGALAIEARPPVHPTDVRIGWLALTPGTLRAVHAAACAGVIGWIWWCLGGRPDAADGRGRRALGAAALVALAMVLCSERSWKHHYVLLPLPLAYLAWHAGRGSAPTRRVARLGLVLAALAFAGTGELFLGAAGADRAEALGAYAAGALALLVTVGSIRRAEGRGRAEDPCLGNPDSLS